MECTQKQRLDPSSDWSNLRIRRRGQRITTCVLRNVCTCMNAFSLAGLPKSLLGLNLIFHDPKALLQDSQLSVLIFQCFIFCFVRADEEYSVFTPQEIVTIVKSTWSYWVEKLVKNKRCLFSRNWHSINDFINFLITPLKQGQKSIIIIISQMEKLRPKQASERVFTFLVFLKCKWFLPRKTWGKGNLWAIT
jgi:hypothetical protein